MARKAKKVEQPVEVPPADDLAPWFRAMGLSDDGSALPPAEAAKRAHEAQAEAERAANQESAKSRTPFYRLPFTRPL